MRALDILLLAALAACVFLALRRMRRGGGGCGSCDGDCEHCRRRK